VTRRVLPMLAALLGTGCSPTVDEVLAPIGKPTPQRRSARRPRRPAPPMQTAYASYYIEHGTGACGVGDVQIGYRFASLILRCGTRVRFCRGRSCATAAMSDHGPYVAGRTFDLNANLRSALQCAGLCWVQYRVLP
jgi:hypothetical protein